MKNSEKAGITTDAKDLTDQSNTFGECGETHQTTSQKGVNTLTTQQGVLLRIIKIH